MSGPAFTRAAFFEALARTRDLYAELLEIDGKLAWLRAQGDLAVGGTSWDVLPGGRALSLGTGTSVRLTLGRTHPFEVNVMAAGAVDPLNLLAETLDVVDGIEDRTRGPFAEIAAAARGRAEARHHGWTVSVRSHVDVDSADFMATIRDLEHTHTRLTREIVQHDVAQLGPGARRWEGEAADAFRMHFYDDLDLVRSNQCWVVNHVHRLCGEVMKINAGVQGGFMSAVVATEKALDEQLRQRHDKKQATTVKEALALASMASGTAAAVTAAAPPVAATFASLSGVSGVASTLVDGDGLSEEVKIKGADADGLADSFEHAITSGLAGHHDRDVALGEEARSIARLAEHLDAQGHLTSPPPFLGAPPTPCGFHHTTSTLPD